MYLRRAQCSAVMDRKLLPSNAVMVDAPWLTRGKRRVLFSHDTHRTRMIIETHPVALLAVYRSFARALVVMSLRCRVPREFACASKAASRSRQEEAFDGGVRVRYKSLNGSGRSSFRGCCRPGFSGSGTGNSEAPNAPADELPGDTSFFPLRTARRTEKFLILSQ